MAYKKGKESTSSVKFIIICKILVIYLEAVSIHIDVNFKPFVYTLLIVFVISSIKINVEIEKNIYLSPSTNFWYFFQKFLYAVLEKVIHYYPGSCSNFFDIKKTRGINKITLNLQS